MILSCIPWKAIVMNFLMNTGKPICDLTAKILWEKNHYLTSGKNESVQILTIPFCQMITHMTTNIL